MVTRLPRWVWPVAWVFAFVAGMVNVVGLVGFNHQAVTHLTGTTSLLGASLVDGHAAATARLAAVVGAFVAGCVLGGWLVGDNTLRLGRRHGVVLGLETLLLCAAAPLFPRHGLAGTCLAAAACGLQNSMSSAYSGGIVRTTHVSGMFTDLGIFIGHALRGLPVDARRVRLCAVVISGFLLGGVLAGGLFHWLGYGTLLLPAALTGCLALACLYTLPAAAALSP